MSVSVASAKLLSVGCVELVALPFSKVTLHMVNKVNATLTSIYVVPVNNDCNILGLYQTPEADHMFQSMIYLYRYAIRHTAAPEALFCSFIQKKNKY